MIAFWGGDGEMQLFDSEYGLCHISVEHCSVDQICSDFCSFHLVKADISSRIYYLPMWTRLTTKRMMWVCFAIVSKPGVGMRMEEDPENRSIRSKRQVLDISAVPEHNWLYHSCLKHDSPRAYCGTRYADRSFDVFVIVYRNDG